MRCNVTRHFALFSQAVKDFTGRNQLPLDLHYKGISLRARFSHKTKFPGIKSRKFA